MYHMLCFMFLILLSVCSLQTTTCTVIHTLCHLPVNLNCLFIHVSRLSSFSSFKQYHSSLLSICSNSFGYCTVSSSAWCPFHPSCLFTYTYILAYSTCSSLSFNTTCCCPLCDLNLFVLSLPSHYTQSTCTIFVPSTSICFRVYCYIQRAALYLPVPFVTVLCVLTKLLFPTPCSHYQQTFIHSHHYHYNSFHYTLSVLLYPPVLFVCLFLVLYCNHSFIYTILVPCSVYTWLYTISAPPILVGSVPTTTELWGMCTYTRPVPTINHTP